MSFLTAIFNFIQKVVLALVVIPAAFKLIEIFHNMNQTINRLNESLKAAEDNIGQLRTAVEELKSQIAENRKNIHIQMLTTMDMQQQLVDRDIDAISVTKDIGDIYECLDRLLDLLKSDKARNENKQQERSEIEAIDKKNPNDEIFDNFISDSSNYYAIFNNGGILGSEKLCKLFQEWFDAEYVNINDCPSNGELEEYMCHNFHWTKDS